MLLNSSLIVELLECAERLGSQIQYIGLELDVPTLIIIVIIIIITITGSTALRGL
jgi:hypothetical protein